MTMDKIQFIWSIITSLIGGLVALIGWSLTVGRKLQVLDDLKENFKDIKSDIKNLDYEVKGEMKEVKEEIRSLEKSFNISTGAIVEMQTLLAGKGFTIRQQLIFTSRSPIELTEFGEDLMKNSGFYEMIKDPEKVKYLIGLVKAKNPQTNYDIQETAMKVMQELAENNDPIAVPLKNYAYNKGLVLDLLVKSAGLVLRDEVMKELKFQDNY